jgi:hypothetical protein
MHNCKLLLTNDEGRKQHDLVPSARTESSLQQSRSFMHNLHVYRVCNKQITLDVCGSVHRSIICIENPTRCNSVSKFYFILI